MPFTVRHAYSVKPRVRVEFGYYDREGVFVPEVSRTKQEFKDECDINRIMAKAISTGVFPPNLKVGRYGDFSQVGEYQDALERVKVAEEQFNGLPASVRDRFKNNPVEFLAWISDRKNFDEACDLGLLSDEATKRIVSERKAAAVPVPEVKPPA